MFSNEATDVRNVQFPAREKTRNPKLTKQVRVLARSTVAVVYTLQPSAAYGTSIFAKSVGGLAASFPTGTLGLIIASQVIRAT